MIIDDDQLITIAQDRFDPSMPPEEGFRLTVIDGPDHGEERVLNGTEGRWLVGTGPACHLRLRDASVSRRHMAFEWVDGRLLATDLGSRNGTFVDSVRVTGAYLRGGETLALGETRVRVEATSLAKVPTVETRIRFGRVVGGSLEMRRAYAHYDKLARSALSVLIEGETGTGKEVFAESLHEQSPRASEAFVVFDCTTASPSLVESELFGHERGAFTGAVGIRRGVFEEAHRGTLFLDEIGDLSPELQPKLLRALDSGLVKRVGGDRWIRVDVRVLAATRRNLDREVQAGRFRDDLFHRLAMTRIELPPLRSRKGDIPLLARYFAAQLGGNDQELPVEVLMRWNEYAWPGNVRELRNAVVQYLALGQSDVDLRPDLSAPAPEETHGARGWAADLVDEAIARGTTFVEAKKLVMQEFERRFLERVLAANGGNIVRAAAASGIGRRYFQMLRARQRGDHA